LAARRARDADQTWAEEQARAVDQPQIPVRIRDWRPAWLSITLALLFAILAVVNGSALGMGVAVLFVVVTVILALRL
jgi:hypothetical protein